MKGAIETHPLISVRSTATVADAARLMADCGMGAVGVDDEQHNFIGIFTERDLADAIGRWVDVSTIKLGEVVNDFPVVVEGPVSFAEATDQMRRSRIRHLIVRERDDYRIVSMRDLFLSSDQDESTAEVESDLGYLAAFTGSWPMRAEDVMSAPPICVRESARLEEVAEILADREISGMPVVDAEDLIVGVISERDVAHVMGNSLVRLALRRSGPTGRWGRRRNLEGRCAEEAMTTPAVVVSPDTLVTSVAEIMFKDEINRVPVVKGGRVLGIITRGDVLAAFAGLPHQEIDLTSGPVVTGGTWISPEQWAEGSRS